MDEVLSENAQMIKNQLHALVELQGLDNEINERRARIKALQENIDAESRKLESLHRSVADSQQELDRLLKDRRQAELESKEKQEQAQKLAGQLFDVKTNEAYQTLQSEISHKKQENALLEERILEMMMAEDEARKRIAEAEAQLRQSEKAVADVQSGFQREIKDLEGAIAGFEKTWDEAAVQIKPEYLDHYKRLRGNKGGKAMAKIENDICTGCRLSIRPQATIELRKYRSLLYCDNCARILYVD